MQETDYIRKRRTELAIFWMMILLLFFTSKAWTQPEIDVYPFDTIEVPVDDSDYFEITITNMGSEDLEVNGLELGDNSGFFVITDNPTPITLSQDESTTATVEFAPQAAGTFEATLTINYNEGNESVVVDLTGIGLAPSIDINPISLYFGDVPLNTSADLRVEISNVGSATLEITRFSIGGDAVFEVIDTAPIFIEPEDPPYPLTVRIRLFDPSGSHK